MPAINLVLSDKALAFARRKVGHRRYGVGGFVSEILAREEERELILEELRRKQQELTTQESWCTTGVCVD